VVLRCKRESNSEIIVFKQNNDVVLHNKLDINRILGFIKNIVGMFILGAGSFLLYEVFFVFLRKSFICDFCGRRSFLFKIFLQREWKLGDLLVGCFLFWSRGLVLGKLEQIFLPKAMEFGNR